MIAAVHGGNVNGNVALLVYIGPDFIGLFGDDDFLEMFQVIHEQEQTPFEVGFRQGRAQFFQIRERSPIHALEDLKGKQLAVKKGTSTYGGLLAAFGKANLSPADIRIIDLTPPTMTEALLAGSIDAFAASEPTPSAAEQKGARELTTLGGLGNAYPLLILARRGKLAGQPEAFGRFFSALRQAEAYAAGHFDETARMMADETGLALTTTRRAMQRHQYRLRLDNEIFASLKQTAAFLKAQKVISNLPDFKTCTVPDDAITSR
jgi:sulfonate transport system substrate-binding protein